MTSTDELRRLLDERGVKWWEGEDERTTRWEANSLTWEYFSDENGDAWLGFLGACEQDVSPKQAITATLGTEYHGYEQAAIEAWKSIKAWNIRATHGTLTAEQVREIVDRHWHDLPTERDMPEATALPEYSYDWQAIADELNATLGNDDYEHRMDELLCRLTNGKWSKSRSYSVNFMVSCVDEAYEDTALGNGTCRNEWAEFGKFRCSECWTQVDAISTNTTQPMPIRHCPNCGRRVER